MLLEAITTDYTLVGAMATAIVALTSALGVLWWTLGRAHHKYESLLKSDRDELVPMMVEFQSAAREMQTNATKMLEESIKLRNLRHRRSHGHGSDSTLGE